jgi:hypothetical protein
MQIKTKVRAGMTAQPILVPIGGGGGGGRSRCC